MRLYKLKLKNYIGIYNGMGLYEITINFYKCISNIIVIKGDNGSGKSTILKALNPMNDSSDNFIPNKDAEKEISYTLNNGDRFIILYTSKLDSKGNRKSSCYVKLNDNILNPSGNVNEGKEIIYNTLGLDSGFIPLTELSSDDRGLADKKPADRKKFVNNKISQLEAYNNIYSKVSSKFNILKEKISSISTKITNLGNMELVKTAINTLENTLDELEEKKAYYIATIASYNEKISFLNKDKDIIALQNEYNNRLNEVNYGIQINTVPHIYTDEDINASVSKISLIEYKISSYKQSIDKLMKDNSKLSSKIEEKKIKLQSIGDLDLIKSIESRIEELVNAKQSAIKIFKSINFSNYDNITSDEYVYALNSINEINNSLNYIRSKYEYSLIDFSYNNQQYIPEYTNEQLSNLKKDLEEKLSSNEKLIASQDTLKKSCKDYNMIPSNCNHKTDCIFISSIMDAKSQLLPDKDYNKLISLSEDIRNDIKELSSKQEYELLLKNCISDVKNLAFIYSNSYNIISKFPINISKNLSSLLLGANHIAIDVKSYLECSNYITLISSCNKDIDSLKERLKTVSGNKELIESLSADIKDFSETYESNVNSIRDMTEYIKELEQTKTELLSTIEIMKSSIEKYNKYVAFTQEKIELETKIKDNNDAYNEIRKLTDSANALIESLKKLNLVELPDINNRLNSYKYKIVLYNDYIKEYNEYNSTYSKLETIKYYCSPTTGIQTVFMEMYMNNILTLSNQLLSMFFNGEYILHPFIINEKEFRIPCLGKGIMNDDISSMSTSQICMISMILSFALLHQTSTYYNIIKIDEIDGGLDTQNRLNFINVLIKLMQTLSYEQCIMISHNTELGMYKSDIILLRNSDPNLKLDGNIIFDLSKEKQNV